MGTLYIVKEETGREIREGLSAIKFRIAMVTSTEIGGWDVETFEVPWDPTKHNQVVVLVARYSDGSSFGRTTGHADIIDAFTSAAAAWEAKCKVEETKQYGDRTWDTYHGRLYRVELYALPLIH